MGPGEPVRARVVEIMKRGPAPKAGRFSTQPEPAAASEHAADALSVRAQPRRLAAISSVLAAMVLVVLNTAIANMALPTIAQSLHVAPALSIWIITANQAALLMALLPCAALGESLGYRRVFRWGVTLFLAATLPGGVDSSRKADLLRIALNAGACASLVIAAGVITERPTLAAALLAISAIQLTLLVKRERQKEAPLIPLDLLRSNSFRISVIASVLSFAGQTAGLVALPFYLHHSLGQGVLMTGLYMISWPLTVALIAPLAGRLANQWSTAWFCSVGGICLSTGLAGAALWPLQENLMMLVPLTMLCGLGFGLFNVANNRNMFLAAPMSRSGAAGGMQGTARLLGQTAGAVIMTLLFNLFPADSAPQLALGAGALLNLFAALICTLQGRQAYSYKS